MASEIELPDAAEQGAIVLITGDRRAGKTTLLEALRDAALAAGLSTGGMLSVARIEAGEKTGIDLMDAADGHVHPLADTVETPQSPIHTGRYSFHPAGMAAGWEYAQRGQTADVYFVDELGPLELVRGEGWAAVLPLIRARRFGVALVVVRPELIDTARDLLRLGDEAPTVTVTAENRDALHAALGAWIAQRGRRGG